MLLPNSICIVYEWSKNTNNKNKHLKIKIYYMSFKTMLQYPNFTTVGLKKKL